MPGLVSLLSSLAGLPGEILAAIWRLLLLLLLLVLELLRHIFGPRDKHPPHRDCHHVPPQIKRKPDPCLYSQFYLIAQGFDVVWDNPDMWVTLPDNTPVNSGALLPDTDYVVHVRIHDASFDPALATQVRCFYRPWSFNSPDRIPLEINPDGSERVVILHIPPWSSDVARFKWRTPSTPNRHYCIQAECRHPDDLNPNNNLGQENTNVVGAGGGGQMQMRALIANPARMARRIRIQVDGYVIPDGQVRLELRRKRRYVAKRRHFASIRALMLTRPGTRKGVTTYRSARLWFDTFRYDGFQALDKDNARGTHPLPGGWRATIDGQAAEGGFVEIDLAAGASREIALAITPPAGAPRGTRQPVNFTAVVAATGQVLGGVTMIAQVE